MGEQTLQAPGLDKLINRTRFRLLFVCSAVSIGGIFILIPIVPLLFQVGARDAFSVIPLAIAIGGFTGTTQVFFNEHQLQRLVWLAHPEGVKRPQVESVWVLLFKIVLAGSALLLPLGVLGLYTFNVTPFDLFRLGLEKLPDVLLAYTVVFIIVGIGFFVFRRFQSKTQETSARPEESSHLSELVEGTHLFSLQSALVSLLLWCAAGILVAWGYRFLAQFDLVISVWMMVAITALGIVAFPVQYFSFKKVFRPLSEKLLATAGESYRVESAAAVAESLEDEHLQRERLFAVTRLAIAIPVWGVLVLLHDAVPLFYMSVLLGYTIIVVLSYVITYFPAWRTAGSYLRLAGDGVALALFLQYSGSMTTLAGGLFYLMVYSVTLHHGFETGIAFASFYSLIYGAMLLGEYLGWLQYAPAVLGDGEFLRFLLEKAPWRNFHPSALFLSSFILIAGGMFVACFIANTFLKRQGGLRQLLDLD